MSQKYTGGFITKSPVAPTTSAASGIWTLDQQQQAQQAGNWPSPPIFIEDLFSTYLYTGTGATQTITNGINLSANGGMSWSKQRNGSGNHFIQDTVRGANFYLQSDSTSPQGGTSGVTFLTNGYSMSSGADMNILGNTNVNWTFRKQPKFFDIVTYTGTGSATTIAHNLGSVPGCIIVKRTDTATNWVVYHRSLNTTAGGLIALNLTNGELTDVNAFNSTVPTSTVFTVGSASSTNGSGGTFVAYLFAHDAGGFPVSGGGSTNGISCGSYTGNGSTTGPVINLGYEPQWLMIKNASGANEWVILDNMRGIVTDGVDPRLFPNNSDAENTGDFQCKVSATGFQPESISAIVNTSGNTYIYIAIRRGPMKTPTVGTSVFDPETSSASTGTAITTSFPIDLQISHYRPGVDNVWWMDRLRGANSPGVSASTAYLLSDNTNAESSTAGVTNSWDNTGFKIGSAFGGASYVYWNFRRAPGFFDEVCYTGTGSATTFTHNLGVVPELLIIKKRSSATNSNWVTNYYVSASQTADGYLNLTGALPTVAWSSSNLGSAPTSTNFSVGSYSVVNQSSGTFVAYLFATCAGVSKVGSYTGNGTTQTINCGFTGGARFVLIKRTDSTGDWYVWDSARGIVAGNDPHLSLNTTAAEVTTDDSVDTDNSGFIVNQDAATNINVTSATYIFLAIA